MSDKLYFKPKSKKTGGEIYIDGIYNEFKTLLVDTLGKDATNNAELNKVSKVLFGRKFKGVYPMEDTPILKDKESAIVNTGYHWVPIYMNKDTLIISDSFGRKYESLFKDNLKDKYKKIVNSDLDSEQKTEESTCGPQSIAWLCVVYNFGIDNALLI